MLRGACYNSKAPADVLTGACWGGLWGFGLLFWLIPVRSILIDIQPLQFALYSPLRFAGFAQLLAL